MGRKNAALIRLAEHLKRSVGREHAAYKIAEAAVSQSQGVCPHPEYAHSGFTAKKASPRGSFKAGDKVVYCRDCAKPLLVFPC